MVITVRVTYGCVASCLTALQIGKRAVVTAVALLALAVGITADVPVMHVTPLPDPRAASLERLWQRYHCPAPHHTSEYLNAADGYGLDYRLLPAISIRETLCGAAEKQNNRWGFHPGRRTSFPSIQVGIDFLARRLAGHPLYRGKTLQDKLFTYNPRPAYPAEIKRIMDQIE
jgi:hypothetical protein